jgi:soluble lytic murein transglycosylase-like protein
LLHRWRWSSLPWGLRMKKPLDSSPLPPASRRTRLLIAGVGGLAVSTMAGTGRADIYKQVGADGVISFTSRPAQGSKLYAADKKAPVFMPSDDSPERFGRYDEYIRQAATLYQIPEELVRAVIRVESDFDPRAVSPANARGLMQLVPETAERMMVTDSFDPRQNIFGGVRYLRVLANMFNGDLELTVAGYNAGEGAVVQYGGIPPYAQTKDYVVKVTKFYRRYRTIPDAVDASLAPADPPVATTVTSPP